MTHERPITMLLHQSEYLLPGVGNAPGAPVVDGGGFNVENFRQSSDASSGLDGLVKDLHGQDDITKVSDVKHFCASIIGDMSTLAKRLKEARIAKGKIWSQKHLAIVAGVSTGTIGMMELGKRGNKDSIAGTVPQIAKALGVNFEWLAYGTGDKFPDQPVPNMLASIASMSENLQLQISQLAILLNSAPPDRQTEAYIAATQALIRYLPGAATPKLLPGPPGRS
jgi:transcriptional regulator with XRE-family HTH domain